MDPVRSLKPKNWRTYGRLAPPLILVAVLMAAAGWLTSMLGHDPGTLYRLAALATAGAMLFGLIWVGSSTTDETEDGR